MLVRAKNKPHVGVHEAQVEWVSVSLSLARTNMSNVTLPFNVTQRGLSLRQAAAYWGVCPNTYRKLEALGVAPKPMHIPGVSHRRYDRLEHDRALDARRAGAA